MSDGDIRIPLPTAPLSAAGLRRIARAAWELAVAYGRNPERTTIDPADAGWVIVLPSLAVAPLPSAPAPASGEIIDV